MNIENSLLMWKIILWGAPIIGLIIAFVANYNIHDIETQISKQKEQKTEQLIEENMGERNTSGDVNVSENIGNTQVAVNSPGSQQTINEKRVIKTEVKSEKGMSGGLHLLRLTFEQTNGIWDSGEKFWLQIQLTGSYSNYRFTSGISAVLQNVRTTQGNQEATQKGWIELETTTPQLNEPIVLEIYSENDINVANLKLSPAAGYKINN